MTAFEENVIPILPTNERAGKPARSFSVAYMDNASIVTYLSVSSPFAVHLPEAEINEEVLLERALGDHHDRPYPGHRDIPGRYFFYGFASCTSLEPHPPSPGGDCKSANWRDIRCDSMDHSWIDCS